MLAKKLEHDYAGYASYPQRKENIEVEKRTATRVVCNTELRRKVLALVLLTLSFAFYMVMRNDVYIQNGYLLVQMKEQEADLMKNIEYLEVNLAKAKSPERITLLAQNLGMVLPEKNVYVKAGKNSGKKTEQETMPFAASVAWRFLY